MRRQAFTKRYRMALFLVLCCAAAALAGCAHQPKPETIVFDPPGFFSGLLHGFLIIFSFLGSLVADIRIYAFPNSGGWYDFGYLIGVGLFFGGGASAR